MTQAEKDTQPENWLPETVSYAQFRQILIDRDILGRCEACRHKSKGWMISAQPADGKLIEFNLHMLASGTDHPHIENFALLTAVCEHCGNTRFYHKRTLFAAINGLMRVTS